MKSRKCITLMLCLLFAIQASAQTNGGPKVTVKNGVLEGLTAGSVDQFFGIPYAQPPVNELRWQNPLPAKNWSGVRKATTFGPRAMQKFIYTDMIFRSPKVSEDCLYLNVWRPSSKITKKLPVLVYFHGGGFSAGDGSELRYDGADMASKGIIVVTVNYRMGIFGFFAHPEISKFAASQASGDYGLLDQVASLRWVKENIAAFGGDPEQVTIGGQSAGSISVSLLMASPLAKGLFNRAIGQSGSILGINKPIALKQAEALGVQFLSDAKLPTVADLKKMPAEELLELSRKPGAVYFPVIVDGYFLPEQPVNIYTKGLQADVPLLAGWTSAEVNYHSVLGNEAPTVDNYIKALDKIYGDKAAEAKRAYAVTRDEDVIPVATELAGDRFLGFSTWKWIDLHGKTNGYPVFRYLYKKVLPAVKGKEDQYQKPVGAPHSADIAYAMGNLGKDQVYAYGADDYKASAAMEAYFINFIKTGDPNGPGLSKWSGLQSSIPQVMYLDTESKQGGEQYQRRYQFMDQLYYK
ncbi:carboxylesterase/lipase family protein [Pedobacter sp. PWIIR3]